MGATNVFFAEVSGLKPTTCSLAALLLYPNSICRSSGELRWWVWHCKAASSLGGEGDSRSKRKLGKLSPLEVMLASLMKKRDYWNPVLRDVINRVTGNILLLCSQMLVLYVLCRSMFSTHLKMMDFFSLSSLAQSLLDWVQHNSSSSKPSSIWFTMCKPDNFVWGFLFFFKFIYLFVHAEMGQLSWEHKGLVFVNPPNHFPALFSWETTLVGSINSSVPLSFIFLLLCKATK